LNAIHLEGLGNGMATRSGKGPFATHKNTIGIEQKACPLKSWVLGGFLMKTNVETYFIQVHLERLQYHYFIHVYLKGQDGCCGGRLSSNLFFG